MEEIKVALKNLWKVIIKYLLSKTTIDEEIAAKAKEIDSLDEEKPKQTETKKEEE
jgi:hypothetical protein